MKSFALIIVMWVIALLSILVLSEHRPANGGAPIVNSASTDRPAWTLMPQCPVTSRNLRRYSERIA